ncbi:TonB-dependent siderophore receptor [Acinetobacter sp. C26M]|uniref:TonB-dependent receptor family protein n=1 Tax=unclassified Acinetobacter TaxID=196816 RepID=UPI00203714E9|nr:MULTISPECIES: TonB-dependent siderophore receptor [unclassified Acinetobacter]USA45648.1 TonB-dependent siderophore receptor [Acinetobacter sp. C26M]USA49147.1 TonB-dependent siderophore receptor [Acinetobacter sp. C26G]
MTCSISAPLNFSKFKPSSLSCAIATMISCFATTTFAEDNLANTTQTLATISIQAEGNWLEQANAKKVLNHSGARTVVDQQALEARGITSVKEALRTVPGIQASENSGTSGSDASLSIGVRGLVSRFSPRSQLMIDGVPLAVAPYGQPQLSLAPTTLGNMESIDVVRGAGSVRFGPQNVGGIINFNTRSIPEHFAANIGMTTEIAENGNLKVNPNLFVGTTLDNGLGLALLYSGVNGDGYRDQNDYSNINDLRLKASYALDDYSSIEANLHRYEAKVDMPGGLTPAQYAQNPYQSLRNHDYMEGNRNDISLKYNYKKDNNAFEVLTYHLDSYRDAGVERLGSSVYQTAPRDYKVTAIEPRYSHAFPLGNTLNEVSVGYRYLKETSRESVDRASYNNDTGPRDFYGWTKADGDTEAHAFYVDNRTDLGAWSLTPGLRFERIKINENMYKLNRDYSVLNGVNASKTYDSLLPSFAVMYKANEQWNIFANYGKSFAPFQYSQMTNTDSNGAYLAMNGLNPEKADNYEIGTHYLDDYLSLEFTLFYIDFADQLKRDDATQTYTNLGATKHKGAELGLKYNLGAINDTLANVSVYANTTYTKATASAGQDSGNDLDFYSNWIGNAGIDYKYDQWTFNTNVYAQSSQVAAGKDDATGRYGNIPGYGIVGMRAAYDFTNTSLSGLKVGLGVKNLFNQEYYTRSSDQVGGIYAGPSRTYYLQTSFDF